MKSLTDPFTPEEMAAIRQRARNDEPGIAGFWAWATRFLARLPFAEDAAAAWFAVADPATPARVRFILGAALANLILPLDAVPDLVPGLGFTDDAAVLAAAILSVRESILPAHRIAAHRALAALRGEAAAAPFRR